METNAWDLVIVGAGIAGLSAALEIQGLKTLILTGTRERLGGSSYRAQGGIACPLDESDVESLIQDTLKCGAGTADLEAVKVLVKQGLPSLQWLERQGVLFDRGRDGDYQRGQEGAHSQRRVLHCGGDSTGRGLLEPLLQRVLEKSLTLKTNWLALEILKTEDGSATAGLRVLDEKGVLKDIFSPRVLLAGGGLGQLFGRTTNPVESQGLCQFMAYEAGVPLADMEMVQFHPTGLNTPQLPDVQDDWAGSTPLLSEALRGEGAILVDQDGSPVKIDHPMGSLGSRDIVARALHAMILKGEPVFLDARRVHGFARKFPTIWRSCQIRNLDPTQQPLPVVPVVHYHMGGIWTDLWGATPLAGLYAAGECASTGVHGANRLASNSLMECVVFGRRAGQALNQFQPQAQDKRGRLSSDSSLKSSPKPLVNAEKEELQNLLFEAAGPSRSGLGLEKGLQELEGLAAGRTEGHAEGAEAKKGLPSFAGVLARVIVESALFRRESRGAHYRTDYPESSASFEGRVLARKGQPMTLLRQGELP